MGTWKLVFISSEGTDLTKANAPHIRGWRIERDKITILSHGHQDRGSWAYRSLPGDPRGLDLTPLGHDMPPYPCIYKVEGNRLTVMLQSVPERGRPRDFACNADPGVGVHVLVRQTGE